MVYQSFANATIFMRMVCYKTAKHLPAMLIVLSKLRQLAPGHQIVQMFVQGSNQRKKIYVISKAILLIKSNCAKNQGQCANTWATCTLSM
eukprot:6214834-Pleurochrysis_carterae.AAC.2